MDLSASQARDDQTAKGDRSGNAPCELRHASAGCAFPPNHAAVVAFLCGAFLAQADGLPNASHERAPRTERH